MKHGDTASMCFELKPNEILRAVWSAIVKHRLVPHCTGIPCAQWAGFSKKNE